MQVFAGDMELGCSRNSLAQTLGKNYFEDDKVEIISRKFTYYQPNGLGEKNYEHEAHHSISTGSGPQPIHQVYEDPIKTIF